MRMFTIKTNPKVIFGSILAITGVIVIVLSFIGNHAKTTDTKQNINQINCSTTEQRMNYLTSLGWETDDTEKEKKITIPSEFNEVYEKYNAIQKQQGFDLEAQKGKSATIYTYNITNYKESDNVIADLMVADGVLIGADLCNPSADDGFLIALDKNE